MSDDQGAHRRINLGDAMFLIVAVALICWLLISDAVFFPVDYGISVTDFLDIRTWNELFRPTLHGISNLSLISALCLFMAVVALFPTFAVIRLRRPRPPLRDVILQPGMLAFLAWGVSAALAVVAISLWPRSALEKVSVLASALAVPIAWGFLLATHRWHPEPGWIDRFGRLLAELWWFSSWVYLATSDRVFLWPWT